MQLSHSYNCRTLLGITLSLKKLIDKVVFHHNYEFVISLHTIFTGGETHGGSLYMITLDDLYKGDVHKVHKHIKDQMVTCSILCF